VSVGGEVSFFGFIAPKLTGIYFVVDEQAAGPNSFMAGAQTSFAFNFSKDFNLTIAGAYYDYILNSLNNADIGDKRSNQLNADKSGYASDFNLLDTIIILESLALGRRWPIELIGDYVINLGAGAGENQGFGVDIYVGRDKEVMDFRFRYGYAQNQADAVLAAFSQDNITIATNYKLHTAAVDFVVLENTVLNATWYIFCKNQLAPADSGRYASRIRLNVTVKI